MSGINIHPLHFSKFIAILFCSVETGTDYNVIHFYLAIEGLHKRFPSWWVYCP